MDASPPANPVRQARLENWTGLCLSKLVSQFIARIIYRPDTRVKAIRPQAVHRRPQASTGVHRQFVQSLSKAEISVPNFVDQPYGAAVLSSGELSNAADDPERNTVFDDRICRRPDSRRHHAGQ